MSIFNRIKRPVLLGRSRSGQGSLEWVAICVLICTVVGAGAVALMKMNAIKLQWLPRRIACVIVNDTKRCNADPMLASFSPEQIAKIRENMPETVFEDENGSITLPVDYRDCRERDCADSDSSGEPVKESDGGQKPTVFVEVFGPESYLDKLRESLDKLPKGLKEEIEKFINDPSKHPTFYQYWFYFPDSRTDYLPGGVGKHPDDWESYQVKEMPDGSKQCRSSAHHGYSGGGPNARQYKINQIPIKRLRELFGNHGWGSCTGFHRVSKGSHAGHIPKDTSDDETVIGPDDYETIPIVGLDPEDFNEKFGDPKNPDIKPPWNKDVWDDPFSKDT